MPGNELRVALLGPEYGVLVAVVRVGPTVCHSLGEDAVSSESRSGSALTALLSAVTGQQQAAWHSVARQVPVC